MEPLKWGQAVFVLRFRFGQWKSKFFPMDYDTEEERLTFVLGDASTAVAAPGAWRSHFAGRAPEVDPGADADASTGTFFLVRDRSSAGVAVDAHMPGETRWNVTVGVNEIVTLSTETRGIPDVAPTLPRSPPRSSPSCEFPSVLREDFEGIAPAQAPKYFQDMHGAFEAVADDSKASREGKMVLRQMSVGQPIGFHEDDPPPLSIVGTKAAVSGGCVSVSFRAEEGGRGAGNNSAVLALHVSDANCGHCGAFLAVCPVSGAWRVGPTYSETPDPRYPPWQSGRLASAFRRAGPTVWHTMALNTSANGVSGTLDGVLIFSDVDTPGVSRSEKGWVGVGTSQFTPMLMDDFSMALTVVPPGRG